MGVFVPWGCSAGEVRTPGVAVFLEAVPILGRASTECYTESDGEAHEYNPLNPNFNVTSLLLDPPNAVIT